MGLRSLLVVIAVQEPSRVQGFGLLLFRRPVLISGSV
jgi:hypothetical protein